MGIPLFVVLAVLLAHAAWPISAGSDSWFSSVGSRLASLSDAEQRAYYAWSTDITAANDAAHAAAAEALLVEWVAALQQRGEHAYSSAPGAAQRMAKMLDRVETPPLADAAQRARFLALRAQLEGGYSAANVSAPCADDESRTCWFNLGALEAGLARLDTSAAWKRAAVRAWMDAFRGQRGAYLELVQLGNAGAGVAGFSSLAAMWRSWYDVGDDALVSLVRRLWNDLSPMYAKLHCLVRRALRSKYGDAEFAGADGQIPAHLLGNMWAQDWTPLYELVAPFPGAAVSPRYADKLQSVPHMVELALAAYQSAGFASPPADFVSSSMWKRPTDGRSVVCHASAWDLGPAANDLFEEVRIKMCADVDEASFRVMFHELGHVFYYLAYSSQPGLFRQGANPGFHEAVGDAMLLSLTPAYLHSALGVSVPQDTDGQHQLLLNQLMMTALEKVAFLPFGMLVDQWRWGVFEGNENIQEDWWHRRAAFQGVSLPVGMSDRFSDESYFDAGSKYHVSANVPYIRYFFATVLQFQFHRQMCRVQGYSGPLANCSVLGSPADVANFRAMLSLGSSLPWMEALTLLGDDGSIDSSAMIEYFAPLMEWIDSQLSDGECDAWQPFVEYDVLVNTLWMEFFTEAIVYIVVIGLVVLLAAAVAIGVFLRRRQKLNLFNEEKERLSREKSTEIELEEGGFHGK